jgi:plasmid stabilization system protein ParE
VSSYILSVDADFDLDDIWEYIAADRRRKAGEDEGRGLMYFLGGRGAA